MHVNPNIRYKKGQKLQEGQENKKVSIVMLSGFVKEKYIEVATIILDNDKVWDDS